MLILGNVFLSFKVNHVNNNRFLTLLNFTVQEKINQNLSDLSTWKRIFFMLAFAVIIGLVRILLWAVILLQVTYTLLTGDVNKNILNFGRILSAYTYHILIFLTFNSEQVPFPFSDWSLTEQSEKSLQGPDSKR